MVLKEEWPFAQSFVLEFNQEQLFRQNMMTSSFQDIVYTRVGARNATRANIKRMLESNNLSLFLSIWKTLKPCIGNCRIIAQSPRHSVLEKVVFRSSRPFFLICLFSQSLVVELIAELLPGGCFVWLAFFGHFSFLNSVLVMQRRGWWPRPWQGEDGQSEALPPP